MSNHTETKAAASSGGGSGRGKSKPPRKWAIPSESAAAPPAVKLDSQNRLNLDQVIRCFNSPITEEHAWAVIYQTVKTLDILLQDQGHLKAAASAAEVAAAGGENSPALAATAASKSAVLAIVTHSRQILIRQDGVVADETFCVPKTRIGHIRTQLLSEDKALSELGLTIFEALDQGLAEDQERQLSSPLESVLDQMASLANNDPSFVQGNNNNSNNNNHGDQNEHHETLDEGIDVNEVEEEDDDEANSDVDKIQVSGSCKAILDVCQSRLAVGREAESHFKAVCRALVSEALELSTFIQKVSNQETEASEELNQLALQDWARLWVQVLKDLRTGAKLKNVNYTKTPVEFELTPYEILMEDIRRKNFTLNKVMVDGRLPSNVKKDAHAVILEFIRSRPPLKPASKRELKPKKRKESTPVEQLMDSIRGSNARTSLRKTKGPELRSLRARLGYESSRTGPTVFGDHDLDHDEEDDEEDEEDSMARRKVTLDPNQEKNLLDFSGDEEDDDLEEEEEKESDVDDLDVLNGESPFKRCYRRDKDPKGTDAAAVKRKDSKEKTKDSTNNKKSSFDRKHRRRHSLTVCETPPNAKQQQQQQQQITDDNKVDEEIERSLRYRAYKSQIQRNKKRLAPPPKVIYATQFSTTSTVSSTFSDDAAGAGSSSSSASASNSNSSLNSPVRSASVIPTIMTSSSPSHSSKYQINKPQMHATLHSEFIQSDHWATALQTLDLTLDEVVHIRSVLTKAEMESLPLDGTLKEDVEKGKVCFLCMKSRFGTLWNRGIKCQLCKQKVCHKCSTKMIIPLEQFSTTPVFTLEPAHTAAVAAATAAAQPPPRNGSPSCSNDVNSCQSPTDSSCSSVQRKNAKVSKRSSFRIPSFSSWRNGGGGGSPTAAAATPSPPPPADPGVGSTPNSPMHNSWNFMTSPAQPSSLQSAQYMTSSLTSFNTIDYEDEYAGTVVAAAAGTGSVANLFAGPSSLDNNSQRHLQANHRSSFYMKSNNKNGGGGGRRNTYAAGGQELKAICVDCKEMVLQVIRAQSTARRLQLAKSLFRSQAPLP